MWYEYILPVKKEFGTFDDEAVAQAWVAKTPVNKSILVEILPKIPPELVAKDDTKVFVGKNPEISLVNIEKVEEL